MKKKAACYDVDGTLSEGMIIIPLMKDEFEHGLISKNTYENISRLLERYKNGDINYEIAAQYILDIHASGLQGQSISDLETNADKFIQKNDILFRPFGKEAISLLRSSCQQVIVTAEPQYLAKMIAQYYGTDKTLSTEYEVIDGKFTGKILVSLADRNAKLVTLNNYDIIYAFGDSEGDIEMLRKSKHSFCINPTNELRKIGLSSGWHIYDDEYSKIIEDIRQTLKLSSSQI